MLHKTSFVIAAFTEILVFGGKNISNKNGKTKQTKLEETQSLSLVKENNVIFKQPKKLPSAVSKIPSTFINGKLIACGIDDDGCYEYVPDDNDWTLRANLVKRRGPARAIHDYDKVPNFTFSRFLRSLRAIRTSKKRSRMRESFFDRWAPLRGLLCGPCGS